MAEGVEAAAVAARAQRRVGSSVRDKYRIVRVLGIGGMATVYQAVHRNGHKVALKVLNPELAVDEDIRARFVREGYAANAIEHPGVLRILDDDVLDDGAACLVMELLEGETLQSRMMRAGGALGAREVLALAYQLLDVVAAAHEKGILHRDLKPDNLFLTRAGMVKVLDFGVARMVIPGSGSDPTRTGRTMGTPAFMAPEQAFGKTREVDARSDLWSVGATMFTLLTGRHVHEAENAAQLLVIAATVTARKIASVSADVPAPVAAIVDRACAFERSARWPDALAMQEAVSEAHRALYGSDVASALVSTSLSRTAIESAPTLDSGATRTTSSASLPGPGTPSAGDPRKSDTAPRARVARTNVALAIGVAAAITAVGATLATGAMRKDATLASLAPAVGAPRDPAASRTPVAPLAPRCTTSAACDGSALCRSGACVPLASEDCTVLARPEDVTSDATVWVGAMFATTGPMASDFDGAMRDIELARRDFMEVASGLPAARPGGPPRPIGVVTCNDANDPLRAARHLAEELQFPAIIGFSRSKEVTDLAAAVFNPRKVVAFASNLSAMLSAIPPPPGEPRMVWRTTMATSMRVSVLSAVVRDVFEPEMRARGEVKKGEAMRVAFVNVDNTTGVSNADTVATALRFNGKTVSENGDDFLQLVVGDTGDRKESIDRLLPQLVAFRPHAIIDVALGGALVPLLEAAFARAAPSARVRTRLAVGALGPEIESLLGDPAVAARVLAVDAASDTPASTKFEMRFAAVFDPRTKPTDSVTGGPYDAFYTLAYAIVALGDARITGPAIARALPRLGAGPRIDVGPGGIYAATGALARGESIDLQGTTTGLDFDPVTGDPTVDFAISCARPGRDGAQLRSSGLTWDPRTRAVSGKSACR